jgi:hypothetical protein
MSTHGCSLPFLHELTGSAGHDLLLLNARPDLAPHSASASSTTGATACGGERRTLNSER